jgi:Mlc titration factor MtfA (ptsG expression regulator)
MNNSPIYFLLKVNQKREVVDAFVKFLAKLNFTHVETFYLDDKEYEVILTSDSIQNLSLVENMKYTAGVWFGGDYFSNDDEYMDEDHEFPDETDMICDCDNCMDCNCTVN